MTQKRNVTKAAFSAAAMTNLEERLACLERQTAAIMRLPPIFHRFCAEEYQRLTEELIEKATPRRIAKRVKSNPGTASSDLAPAP